MGDEDGGDANAVDDVTQPLPQRPPHLRVQRPKGLVQQQQPGQKELIEQSALMHTPLGFGSVGACP